ncbi:hypothetical protein ABPG72_003258 [Tetrahymena utriculariae]
MDNQENKDNQVQQPQINSQLQNGDDQVIQKQEEDEYNDENNLETLNKVDKLQNVMNKALEIVGLYKNEIDELKSKIGDMKEIILQRDQQDKERAIPIINQLSLIYREEFSKLMDENKQLESELITAIKEKEEVVEQIYSCVDKIKLLEGQVFKGDIPPYQKKKLLEQQQQQNLHLVNSPTQQ